MLKSGELFVFHCTVHTYVCLRHKGSTLSTRKIIRVLKVRGYESKPAKQPQVSLHSCFLIELVIQWSSMSLCVLSET